MSKLVINYSVRDELRKLLRKKVYSGCYCDVPSIVQGCKIYLCSKALQFVEGVLVLF